MGYTISTHNGSQIAVEHNRRNRKYTDKEAHIDKKGECEIWLDVPIKEAYKRLFADAQEAYNEEQKKKGHAERQIKDYYAKIKEDKQKKVAYELIIQIGSYKEHPDEATSKAILRKFCESWKERNPNLQMIGCYYHADEIGVPHVHIDYIGWADNLKRGMNKQNALVKALNQMGYETENIHKTAQIKWEKAQNEELERIAFEHGLEIVHPKREKQKHMNIKEYKQQKRIEELEEKNKELLEKVNNLIEYNNELNEQIDALEAGAVELAHDIVNREERTYWDEIAR